ncbi:SDR family NAD(P)-dependent oxidoreductase [Mycobacterium sp. 48b]|uniref:SDR family NAD(P)-dependent oxidoreductase n=1 Tax=Mycobacterium sp. 48b TaxID=3400426 RepID=UPI003AACAA98
MTDLNGAAIVTGGSKGIGYAIAKRLNQQGLSVLICSRNGEELDRAVNELDVTDRRVIGMVADVGDAEVCEQLVQRCVDEFGRVDVLVNNAAVYLDCHFLDITHAHWDQHLNVDLRGPALLSVAAARQMKDQGGGRIVHVSSDNALAAEPDFTAYNAAKAALLGLTKSMAVDLARYNILTNCVLPGWTRTSLTEEYLATMTKETLEKVIPLARAGEPEDIAEVVAFLCDPRVTYVLGQAISVDGGLLVKQPTP